MPDDERDDEELGPKDNTDDSTLADMGLTGPPATSSTPVGQGDEAGPGAREQRHDAGSEDD